MMFEERRVEERVRSKGRFQLFVDGAEPLTVYNTSPTGICVEAIAPVEKETEVRLDGEGFVANGVVRYCERLGGLYRIGIGFVPVKSDAGS
jgi:hypothetical protein